MLKSLFSRNVEQEVPVLETDFAGLEALASRIPVPHFSDEKKLEKYLQETYPYVGEGGITFEERTEMQRFLEERNCHKTKAFFKEVVACIPQLEQLDRNTRGKIRPSAPHVQLDEETSKAVVGIMSSFLEQDGWKSHEDLEQSWNRLVPVDLKKMRFSGDEHNGTSLATLYQSARTSLARSSGKGENVVELFPQESRSDASVASARL